MKTKIFFLVLGLTFISISLFSQDLIIKKDKSEIKAKVIEVQENSIKYKPIDFLEGPLRNIPISDVLLIRYENGTIETFDLAEAISKIPVQEDIPVQPNFIQETSNSSYYPFNIFARISGQVWNNTNLSEFFGTNILYGAGIEKQVSDNFKFGACFDFASKSQYEVTLNYSQLGGFIKFSWGTFDTNKFLIYSELGAKLTSIKEMEEGYSHSWSGVGFSAALGFEIILTNRTTLNLMWDTVWSNVDISGEKLNLNNNIFSAGIIFNL